MASIVFIIRSLGLVSNNMLTREMIFNRQSQAELIGNAVGAMATLWMAMKGFGVWSLVYGDIINENGSLQKKDWAPILLRSTPDEWRLWNCTRHCLPTGHAAPTYTESSCKRRHQQSLSAMQTSIFVTVT